MNNPHPIQTDDPDLNVEAIAPGKSITVILTKKGTFGFHNHLNPSDKAKITIQQYHLTDTLIGLWNVAHTSTSTQQLSSLCKGNNL